MTPNRFCDTVIAIDTSLLISDEMLDEDAGQLQESVAKGLLYTYKVP